MKKIIAIAFAAILAGFAISCQKEESVSDKTEAVQYTFNITVNDQVGFDSDALTKGGSLPEPSYKTTWLNGDKIFLFFKPTGGVLLDDRYATLTYNGSSWDGKVSEGQSNLGEDGTLSAVYVYNLSDSVTPVFSDGKWTIATGNTFYNCQTEVSYTVSGSNKISASLVLEAPANFVRFSVFYASGALTCDKVKGWKDIAIGSDLAFSNVTCTGYMDGVANIGDPNVMDYYGRIVSGNSLNGKSCKFSVVKNGKVYEHAATPSTDKRSFTMTSWTEASGKLPGLFTVGKGADDIAGTADDVQVRFSQGNLWYGPATEGAPATFNFEAEQYSISSSWNANHVSNFYWGKTASVAYAESYDGSGTTSSEEFFTNATGFTVGGQTNVWRTLSRVEWKYLFEHYTYKYVSVNGKSGIVIAPDGFSGTIANSYSTTDWATAESNGFVFLPNTGFRNNGTGIGETEKSCIYWTSTASGDAGEGPTAYRMFFQWDGSKLGYNFDETGLRQWAIGIRLVSD